MTIHPHDTATFTSIYNEYFARLFTFAKRFVDNDDAADVLSDVFIGVWKSGAEFENDKALTSYLYRAVRNKCLNHLEQERQHYDVPDIPEEQAVDQSEIIGRVLRELEDLPERQRQIIRLHYLKGLSLHCISRLLAIKYNTVRSATGIAIKKLRKIKR